MGNVMSNYIQAHATHNEKNMCRLFMALRPTGPVAVAFAEIYLMLNQLTPGQTVREYCQNVLGYSTRKYKVFNSDEQRILDGLWDPKLKDVSLLFKLLRHVCGLSQDDSNWKDPAYPLEFHLHTAKNSRNDTMHNATDLTNADLQTRFQELDTSLSSAITLAGGRVGRNVINLEKTFKSDLKSCMNMSFEGSFITGILGQPLSLFVSATVLSLLHGHFSIQSAAGSIGSGLVDIPAGADPDNQDIRAELRKYLREAEALELNGMITIIRRELEQ